MLTVTQQSPETKVFPLLMNFHLPLANALNARLRNEIAAIRRQSPGVQRSNQNGWHSDDDFFDRKEPA